MSVSGETVTDRIDRARIDLAPTRIAVTLVVVAAIGYTLLFLQEPTVHESLHDFRHSIGIVCH